MDLIIITRIAVIGIHKLFSGESNKDFSPLTSQWQDFVLDTLQHKAVLKVLPHHLQDLLDHNHHADHNNDNHHSDYYHSNDDDYNDNDQITERGTEAAAVTTGVQWLAISSFYLADAI